MTNESAANRFKDALESGEFAVTCEIIPGRGFAEPQQKASLEEARAIWATGKVHAISVTDNPGGNPALAASAFAQDLLAAGITPLVHASTKDRSRNQFQGELYAMQRQGLANLLAMSGDAPVGGWQGRSRPVCDLDPVQLLMMVRDMNAGLVEHTPRGDKQERPCSFFAGAVANPFKYTEGEVLPQYFKLRKKAFAGARFIISQLGYDARKMQELLFYLRDARLDVPVIANVFILGAGAARLMKKGAIAGCTVTDELLATVEEEARGDDKGLAARLERAAAMIAIARGLGYAGVHIGGFGITAKVVERLLARADELADAWPELAEDLQWAPEGGFYLYEGDGTGLNGSGPSGQGELDESRDVRKGYGLSRFFHHWVLTRDRRFFGTLSKVMDRRDRKRGIHRKHGIEHVSKALLYGCIDCGDCGLEPCAYSCPMHACPKCQRNGPCGGSMDGWCEVYPGERRCIYYLAYNRLKKHGETERLDEFITPPNNWDFVGTSAWSNYTHGRDNTARRIYLDKEST